MEESISPPQQGEAHAQPTGAAAATADLSVPFGRRAPAPFPERLDEHLDWRYEMRREMQEIVPRVWLGPHAVSKNRDALRARGVTHVVCIRGPHEQRIVRPHFPADFGYLEIQVSDSQYENLIPHFPRSTEFIHNALASGGTVFVHSNSGISRAPAFVVAYIMQANRWDFQNAAAYVQAKRFCTNLHDAFKSQLREYECIFLARDTIDDLNYSQEDLARSVARRRPIDYDNDNGVSSSSAVRYAVDFDGRPVALEIHSARASADLDESM